MPDKNKLFLKKDASHPSSALAVSEAVAVSICKGQKPHLRWNSKEPLDPGYDPIAIFIDDKTSLTAVRFHLVDIETGAVNKNHLFEINLESRDHCFRGAPSIDVATADAANPIIVLMICPTYYNTAVSKTDGVTKFTAVAHPELLIGGKWPKNESVAPQDVTTTWILKKIAKRVRQGLVLSESDLDGLLQEAATTFPTFPPPSV